jgi:Fe-Mn family superoxide dismutase
VEDGLKRRDFAYYLQYKNDRGAYVDKWWDVANWDDVGKRFDKAKH